MGIKRLTNFIFNTLTKCVEHVEYSAYKNKRIAIDGNIYFYKIYNAINSKLTHGRDLSVYPITKEEIQASLWREIPTFFSIFFENQIFPIFFMDGEDQATNHSTFKRRTKKILAKEKYDKLITTSEKRLLTKIELAELRKMYKNKFTMSKQTFTMFHSVMKALVIPIYKSKVEGEKVCTSLCIENFVDTVLTEDSDVLPYGCPEIIRFGNKGFIRFRLRCILGELGLSMSEFIDMCIITGCDYNTIETSPTVSLSFIRDFKTIENALDETKLLEANYAQCREIYRFVPSSELISSRIHIIPNKKICNSIKKIDKQYMTRELIRFHTALKKY